MSTRDTTASDRLPDLYRSAAGSSGSSGGAALAAASAGAVTTLATATLLRGASALRPHLERTNFHGRAVSLRGGAGVALGTLAAVCTSGQAPRRRTALAAFLACATGGAAGLVDDLDAGAHDGDRPAKGLRGHLGALRRGRVTTGVLKIAVIGAGAAAAGTLLATGRRPGTAAGRAGTAIVLLDAATSAVAVASWANVHNLLDLRPGRALKAAGLVSAALLASPGAGPSRALAGGTLGTVAAALPEDLAERTMLGDTGANALGALVGTALAAHPSTVVRTVAAASGTALVLASERVSFSAVIASTPPLAALDSLGRREH